jgi:hypothetical protein
MFAANRYDFLDEIGAKWIYPDLYHVLISCKYGRKLIAQLI